MMMNRWSLFIDIEGFSKAYPENMVRALRPLCNLMEGIFYVGSQVCPETPNRLFAHQIGDAFIVVSEFAERSPEMPIAIGIFLLRHIINSGGMGKCTISQGDFGDIRGCFPEIIRDNMDNSATVRIGDGKMYLHPVMGSALINSHEFGKKESGSLLILDNNLPQPFPSGVVVSKTASSYHVVDWVHSSTQEIDEIMLKTGVRHPNTSKTTSLIKDYIEKNNDGLKPDWIRNTLNLNGCS